MRREREGAALLTVLLLVAVVAALAAALLDDVRFSTRRTMNQDAGARARWQAKGAELYAQALIARLAAGDRTPVQPAWLGRSIDLPVDGGALSARVVDGQACFDLNGLVQGEGEFLVRREGADLPFRALARAVGVADADAARIVDGLIDWMDADATAQPLGAEDPAYLAARPAYRTAGTRLTEVSEMRAVKGVTPDAYRRLRPFLCALPGGEPATLNPNTLTPEQAPLLVMLTRGRLSEAAAREVIGDRPADGWPDATAFWAHPLLAALPAEARPQSEVSLRSRWFTLEADVRVGGARVVRSALLHVEDDRSVRSVVGRWGPEE